MTRWNTTRPNAAASNNDDDDDDDNNNNDDDDGNNNNDFLPFERASKQASERRKTHHVCH